MSAPSIYKVLNIRAEVILAELLDRSDEFNRKDLSIFPDGGFNKVVKRDIGSIDWVENEHGITKTQVTVVRKGMYDALPEGLFHQQYVAPANEGDKGSAILQQFKVRKEQEKNCRRFFSPFDQAFNYYRLRVEEEERKILTGFPIGSRHSLFDIIWSGFEGVMDNYQKSILFSLLPLAHHIVGHRRYSELAFEAVIGWRVSIEQKYVKHKIQLEGPVLSLGQVVLSNDFILGSVSDEQELMHEITVGPIPTEKCMDFLPDARGYKALQTLSDYFLPIDVYVDYKIKMETKPLVLEEAVYGSGENRLGYSIAI